MDVFIVKVPLDVPGVRLVEATDANPSLHALPYYMCPKNFDVHKCRIRIHRSQTHKLPKP